MPKSTLALKATVTRAAAPVPSDLKERLQQLHHQQQSEQADEPEPSEPKTSIRTET